MKEINNFINLFEKCDEKLKTLALTHSSYAHEHSTECNERIEFLGDTVLSTIVSHYLYKNCHYPEGKMSKIRANFVCTESLANVARNLKIESRILLGKSFQGPVSDAVLADTIESMIGVMYLSFGLHSIGTAVLNELNIKEKLKLGFTANDFKSILQELTQSNKQKLKYKTDTYLTRGGQENFRANVLIDDVFYAFGQGSTKREAEQNGAKKTLEKLKKLSQN